MKKNTIDQEIESFLEIWNCETMISFLKDIIPLIQLYDVDEENWLKETFGEDEEKNIRLIRSTYLISKISEAHSGKMAQVKARFKGFHKKLEEYVEKYND